MVTKHEIECAYWLLLGRAPETAEIVAHWQRSVVDLLDLSRQMFASPECQLRLQRLARDGQVTPLTSDELRLLQRYAVPSEPQKGFVISFVGAKTRVEVLQRLAGEGAVESLPLPGNFHGDLYEWLGTLAAVEAARERFVAVELGAGWGPWLVAAGLAAQRRGIHRVQLIGIEGDAGKIEFMRQHLLDNGFDPAQHVLELGIVAERDGTARFPVLEDPADDWGAASLDGAVAATGRRDGGWHREAKVVELPALSLESILAGQHRVDLIHCDIQGDEARVLRSAATVLDHKVAWLVIGTHGRDLELELLQDLTERGWVLEHEKTCQLAQRNGRIVLQVDGCQVWRNPRC